MRIVEITVSKSKKINIGNFESEDVFLALKAELETGDNLEELTRKLYAEIDRLIAIELPKKIIAGAKITEPKTNVRNQWIEKKTEPKVEWTIESIAKKHAKDVKDIELLVEEKKVKFKNILGLEGILKVIDNEFSKK